MQVLEALCGLLIRGEKKDRSAFGWYEKALKAHINLTRLYEYFLYSLPDDYGHALPKEVLLYFSYDKSLDQANKSVLYKNILQYVKPFYGTVSGLCAGNGAVCHGTAACRQNERLSGCDL